MTDKEFEDLPQSIQDFMIEKRTLGELCDPEESTYREKDVIELIEMALTKKYN